MDALRTAFRQGPELVERTRLFRIDRVAKIIADEIPAKFSIHSKIVAHIVPLNNFSTREPIDLSPVSKDRGLLITLLPSGGTVRVNLDGYIALSSRSDANDYAYAQLFRDGVIEVVISVEDWHVRGHNFLPGQHFDEIVQTILAGVKKVYSKININSSTAVMLTLLGMKGRLMGAAKQWGYTSDRPFDSEHILCPDVLLDSLNETPKALAFPIVNLAWNAAGYEQSVFYDKAGEWIGN